jgi:outer membrane protein assembly factor BamA
MGFLLLGVCPLVLALWVGCALGDGTGPGTGPRTDSEAGRGTDPGAEPPDLEVSATDGAPTGSAPETVSGPTPVVRTIIFDRSPIFTDRDRARLRWLPLGVINALHVDTRTKVIRRELVFEEGERIDRAMLDESERRLRGTGFFGEAWVDPITVSPDTVDILVRTREIWTAGLDVSFEKFEDQVLWSLRVKEKNFLGTARSFAIARSVDEDRSTWSVSLGDRQLFDGRWRGEVAFADADDGTTTLLRLSRPFFSLDSTWSTGGVYLNRGARLRYYLNSREYVRPEAKNSGAEVNYTHLIHDSDDYVWRLGAGFSYSDQRFSGEDDLAISDVGGDTGETIDFPDDVRENRNLRVPYLRIQRATRQYTRQRFLYAMGRVEDIPLGFQHTVDLGWALDIGEATDVGMWLRTGHSWFHTRGGSVYTFRADVGGLITPQKAENLRVEAFAAGYKELTRKTKLALGLLGGTSTRLDRNRVFFLGIDSGLRAARFLEFAGDRLVRGNAELRWVHTPGLMSLFTPGFTVFTDVGRAWFENEGDLALADLRGAVGFGIRLGFNRGSSEVPIRIDVAWPILYDEDRSRVLSIGSGQVF